MSKILLLDIETKPAKAYVWRLFDENIGLEQVIDPGGVLCFAAKWLDEKDMHFYSEWEHGAEEMIKAVHGLLSEADAVVTYNGASFDVPKLRGEFVLHQLKDIPPVTHIDVYKTVRQLGLLSNKLAFIGPYFQIGKKVQHEGFPLWVKTMNGNVQAQARMKRYCIQDVRLLEKAYLKLRPYILDHPNLGDSIMVCGACGSKHLQSRGYRRTKYFRAQRLQCQNCGSWQIGKRTRVV